jgi:hypothetical protein
MTAMHQTPKPKVASGRKAPEHLSREEKIDHQMEDSFPASDPPSFSGGNHIIGAPVARESESPSGDAPEVKRAEKKVHHGAAKTPHKY